MLTCNPQSNPHSPVYGPVPLEPSQGKTNGLTASPMSTYDLKIQHLYAPRCWPAEGAKVEENNNDKVQRESYILWLTGRFNSLTAGGVLEGWGSHLFQSSVDLQWRHMATG